MKSHLTRLLAVVVSAAMLVLVGGVTGGGTAAAQPPGVGKKNVVQVQGTGPNGVKFNGQFVATAAKEVAQQSGPATADANGATSSNTGIALTGQLIGKLVSPGQPQPGNQPGDRGAARDVNISNFAMPVNDISTPGEAQSSSATTSTGQNGQVQLASQQAVCDVLNLVLGPLHLELLGLIVDLNQVVLNITADPAGGLLGGLLCALAGGLPVPPNPLQPIIDLLNQILGILGG
ncbi:hypothetical protein BHQ17_26445 [Mycolicibacterium holsaticum]|jgi:hypothetical protein|uniref:ABC transporter substrate-binding protein n=2 Tax=Mycolicibacterium holsaticum TaxID=152142 RepID=A0A1E3R5F3_9MYCO|nr:hypothetical protein [Mycolicibacterium holsaticum DSM 44478 = JCM 12374]ODQ84647.1 hypothetical protein BHQ17_26445 [Mycolicibacterium holsaticum]